MTNGFDPKVMLEAKAKILGICFLWIFGLLLFWFVFFLFLSDWAYSIHSRLFDLTRHEFDLINYCGMMSMKLIMFTFFLVPYIAIKQALKKVKK